MSAPDLECAFSGCGRDALDDGYCPVHLVQLVRGLDLVPFKKHAPRGTFVGLDKCILSYCDRNHFYHGLCKTHLDRFKSGRPLDDPITLGRVVKYEKCTYPGCDGDFVANGLCGMHYQRQQSGYDMDAPKKARHPGELGKWETNRKGYVFRRRWIDGRHEQQLQHRYVMEQKLGRELLPYENVHHINKIKADNREENLELWNTSQPSGARVEDLAEWAKELLALYEPESLARPLDVVVHQASQQTHPQAA